MSNEVQGPYLLMAVLCERVLQEADGVLSVIRIIDRLTLTLKGPGAPEQMPPIPIAITAVLNFKSGFAKGKYKVKLTPNSPSGNKGQEVVLPIFLEGDERGANLIVNLQMEAQEEGLYWIDVQLEEQLLTRMPLRILYQSVNTGA